MPVASEVRNLHSEFGYARPWDSRVIHYVRDGRTDRQTKATLIAPLPTVGGIIIHASQYITVVLTVCKGHDRYV